MNIFITGVNSFVGKALISHLKEYRLFKIYGCDLNVKKRGNNFFSADIRNKNFFKKLPKNIDIIIHLAAVSREKDCSNNIANCYLTNVVGTLNIIEATKEMNIKKIIFASTEWVYPDKIARAKADEDTFIDYNLLTSDYAKSKLISEKHLMNFYNSTNKTDVTILRFGIIYGNRNSNWSAVESLFNEIKLKKKITIGSFKTARRFIHVIDICEGIIKSINLKGLNIINLQGKKLISLKKIVDVSKKILKKKIVVEEKNHNNYSLRNIISIKSNKKIQYQPKIDLKKGLLDFNFYLNNTK
jgi:nucleoside-diphosphate-sugar epimerase